MARRITARRFAHSMLTPEGPSADGASGQFNEIDFDLSGDLGIEIIAITGIIANVSEDTAAAPDVIQAVAARQSIHLDPDTPPDPGLAQTSEADLEDTDSDIIFYQVLTLYWMNGTTEGGVAAQLSPSGRISYVDEGTGRGVFSSRNIQHGAETESNNSDGSMRVVIEYYYVEFTRDELGIINARR